jgi:hypothetical protein
MWTRRLIFFAVGVLLFFLVTRIWGDEGARTGRIAAIAVLVAGLAVLVFVVAKGWRRPPAPTGGVADIAGLIRAGRADEAVRKGRELFEKSPGDSQVAWYFTAALMKSGHIAEARRVFAGLRREALPPKMAALYEKVRTALDSGAPAP